MRKSFSGAAVPTTLTANMSASDVTFIVTSISNWPNTTIGPFVVTVDKGLSTEEKVLCSSYSGNLVTVASGGRGYDGTAAQAHTAPATVNCTLDAVTIDTHDAFVAGNGTVTPSTSAVGDFAAVGVSTAPAAADHKHAREQFGTDITANTAGQSTNNGSSATPARSDHKHATTAAASRAGEVVAFGGVTPPTNSLVCDGSAVSRTTYAALFTAIGTYWGTGDGSTTFNLPDLRGRAPVGVGTVGSSSQPTRALGATGGFDNIITANTPPTSIPAPTTGSNYLFAISPYAALNFIIYTA